MYDKYYAGNKPSPRYIHTNPQVKIDPQTEIESIPSAPTCKTKTVRLRKLFIFKIFVSVCIRKLYFMSKIQVHVTLLDISASVTAP